MIRIDTATRAGEDLRHVRELRIGFVEPSGYVLRIWHPGSTAASVCLFHNDEALPEAEIEYVAEQIVELTIRFSDLKALPNTPLQWYVEVLGEKQSLDRAPREGVMEMSVPSADFERIMWQA